MSRINRIIIDKNIRHGKPVIKGTRVPVDLIVGSLAAVKNVLSELKEKA